MVEKAKFIWFDGKFIPWEQAQVHVLTHTLHYGLGVFEGIRAYQCHDGRTAIFRLKEHIQRLYRFRSRHDDRDSLQTGRHRGGLLRNPAAQRAEGGLYPPPGVFGGRGHGAQPQGQPHTGGHYQLGLGGLPGR